MIVVFNNINNKRYNFTSKFNVRLYKKCLSLKLVLSNNNVVKLPNICLGSDINSFKMLKQIYARREIIPLRLLRFFSLLDLSQLKLLGINNLVSKKLSVYSGNKAKFININRGLLDVTLKCGFRFGDLIFTRALYIYTKKKVKKK